MRVLGTIRLTHDGVDVPLTPSERTLLAGLAVAEHRVVGAVAAKALRNRGGP